MPHHIYIKIFLNRINEFKHIQLIFKEIERRRRKRRTRKEEG
jgi:hypothetical protein